MNVEQTPQTTEPIIPTPVETEQAEPAQSISDHAAQFGPGANAEDGDDTKADRLPHRSDTQKRQQGKFAEGHRRTPRNDWQAKVDQLTGRVKETEGRATAAEQRLAEANAELARLKSSGASPQAVHRQEQRVERAEAKAEHQAPSVASTFTEPEPAEDDPKFAGDYGKYLRAAAAWEGRKAYHDARTAEGQRAAQSESDKAWKARQDATTAKYPNFAEVADRVIAKIPEKSTLERWVYSHKLGDDVLYYFDSHPQELDAILRLTTPLEQIEAVTLLAHQQFGASSKGSGPAASTTSAAERTTWKPAPSPPNVVRTEAQRATDSPPPLDGSLSMAEHRRHFGPKSR